MIKDNKPSYNGSAPSTYLLHQLDTNGLNYSQAKKCESKWYKFVDKNWTGAVMSSFKFQVYGMNQAQAPSKGGVPQGNYFPNLSVRISAVNVRVANWLDIDVSVGNPVNVGLEDNINTYLDLSIGVKSSGWFQTHRYEYAFSITGAGGITFEGMVNS